MRQNRTKNVRLRAKPAGRRSFAPYAGAKLACCKAPRPAPSPHFPSLPAIYLIALKLASAASSVLSTSASVCAVVRNHASYFDGAR